MPDEKPFVHLHCHTDYSLLDGACEISKLMKLVQRQGMPAVAMTDVWGPASVFCQQRRAFLLMDAPFDWETAQDASTGVQDIRIGLVKDHSAVYFPRIVVNDGGLKVPVGPTGAIAVVSSHFRNEHRSLIRLVRGDAASH